MINELIKKLIPYVEENFITFPLWEEGDYRPHIHFWFNTDSPNISYHNSEKLELVYKNLKICKNVKLDLDEPVVDFLIRSIDKDSEDFYYSWKFEIYYKCDAIEDSSFDLEEMLKFALQILETIS